MKIAVLPVYMAISIKKINILLDISLELSDKIIGCIINNTKNLEVIMKPIIVSFLLLMCSLGFCTTYRIGVEDIQYYPLYTTDEHGNYKGYAREILDRFAKSNGYVFEYVALPVKRLFASFLSKKVDFKFPDNPYWGKDSKKGKNVKYSASVTDYIDGVMVLPINHDKGIKSLKILGIVRGFTPWEYLGLVKDKKVVISENNSFPSLLKQALIKRVDGVYANVVVAKYQLDLLGKPDQLQFDPSLPYTHGDYYLSSIKYPNIITQFTEFLSKNKKMIDELKAKYKVTPPKVK